MLLQIAITAALAGLPGAPAAAPAPAQSEQSAGEPRFCRFGELKGGAVRNPDGEQLGTVEDLVIDRGSGAIRYLVMERGGVLGVGARSLALPWQRVAPPSAGPPGAETPPALVARATPEQLDQMPQFDPADRRAIQSRSWIDAMRSAFDDWTDWSQHDGADPFADALDAVEQTGIEGEIVRVRRDRGFEEAAEHVVVEVRTGDGRRVVALGPAWLVMSGAQPPMREAEIQIEAFAVDRGGEIDAVARSFTIEEVKTMVRSEQGEALWAAPGGPADSQESEPTRERLLMASDIVGASVTAHGKDAGEIKGLVIEQTRGVIAFVEIDPDANFLGMADSTRVAPWEALASIGARRARLDAAAQVLTAAPRSPERGEAASWFGDTVSRREVYEAFDLEPRKFGGD